jgi:hypothetical protein
VVTLHADFSVHVLENVHYRDSFDCGVESRFAGAHIRQRFIDDGSASVATFRHMDALSPGIRRRRQPL